MGSVPVTMTKEKGENRKERNKILRKMWLSMFMVSRVGEKYKKVKGNMPIWSAWNKQGVWLKFVERYSQLNHTVGYNLENSMQRQ